MVRTPLALTYIIRTNSTVALSFDLNSDNQHRFRFRSAKEALDLIEKAKKKGEKLPTESRFDSNCITPGTEFMVRLQEALKHFVNQNFE